MKNLLQNLLNYYSITEQEYTDLVKEVSSSFLTDKYHFDNIQKAVELVKNACESKKNIHIYGDYDADGIMGTSILVKMFSYLHYDVTFTIPNRYIDGYGLNLEFAKRIASSNVNFVICIDNGVSSFEAIEYLRKQNIDVVVLDHHEIPEHIPNANVIVHPFFSNLRDTSTSAACVAFFFSIAMLNRFDKYLSCLASISIVSDMMPLRNFNRDLLKIVFKNYTDGEFLQIDLLKGDGLFDENTIGMSIAPKINSIGRMVEEGSLNNIVNYFVSDSRDEILTYYSWINEINDERKIISKQMLESIGEINENTHSIVKVIEQKEGVIGLIANSLLLKYKKPTIIFTKDITGNVLKGSCRSFKGFNIVEVFNELSHLLLNFGGHSLAGGCSISVDDFDEFKTSFEALAVKYPITNEDKKYILLGINDITFENFEMIRDLGPFGQEWPKPLFNLQNVKVGSLKFSKDSKHILTPIGLNSKITGFNISKDILLGKDFVDFKGILRINFYKGNKTLEFLVSDFE